MPWRWPSKLKSELCDASDSYGVRLHRDLKPLAHYTKNSCQAVRAGGPRGRQPALQTFVWFGGQRCELLKTDSGVDKIMHDQAVGSTRNFNMPRGASEAPAPCHRPTRPAPECSYAQVGLVNQETTGRALNRPRRPGCARRPWPGRARCRHGEWPDRALHRHAVGSRQHSRSRPSAAPRRPRGSARYVP